MKIVMKVLIVGLFIVLASVCFADSPFDNFLNPPKPSTPGPVVDVNSTTTEPFLKMALVIYKDTWTFISNDKVFSEVNVCTEEATCNEDKTECCCKWSMPSRENIPTVEGLFCLTSIHDVTLFDLNKQVSLRGLAIQSGRYCSGWGDKSSITIMEDPTIIDFGIFRLVRPFQACSPGGSQ